MKIPFVGPSARARSPTVRNERTLNCYLEVDQNNARAPVALYGTFGLLHWATVGDGPTRGSITSGALTFWVSGNGVFTLDRAGTVTQLGTIGTTAGRVGMASNGKEVLIVDGDKGWLATGIGLTQIIDPDFPNGVTVCACMDGFFIVAGDGSQKFYWNETPNSGGDWNGLDFASVEGSPDDLIGVIVDHRELWFSGIDSTEVFVNTGAADQLFARSGSGIIPHGAASPWTVQSFDNGVVWLSASRDGKGLVLKSQGGNPTRISDHFLEEAISHYPTIADAFAFTYQVKGHLFYVLTFPSGDATWFYDAASSSWAEWSWRDAALNIDHRHRANCYAFNDGQQLLGDWETGKVYLLDENTFTDDGAPIRRLRRTQTAGDSARRLFFGPLVLDMAVAVANDACPDPQVMLKYSDDDGFNWSDEETASLGKVGEFWTQVKFAPSGCTEPGHGRVWEVSMTDPVPFTLFGADVDVTKGA